MPEDKERKIEDKELADISGGESLGRADGATSGESGEGSNPLEQEGNQGGKQNY